MKKKKRKEEEDPIRKPPADRQRGVCNRRLCNEPATPRTELCAYHLQAATVGVGRHPPTNPERNSLPVVFLWP